MAMGVAWRPTPLLQRALLMLALLLVAAASEPTAFEEGEVPEACRAEVESLRSRVKQLETEVAMVTAAAESIQLGEHLDLPGSPDFYRHATCAFGCVALAALAAGLTMGLVSIEPMEMKIIVNTEDKDMVAEKDKLKLKEDQAAAKRVLPLIQDHHRLLVTLLLMNSIAAEALPLFLDKLVPSWLAVAMSVTLVLIFGEIIPSAIFTGSEQLRIAAMFAPIVAFCKFFLTPIAWPIAKTLDVLLGEDHKGRYNFAELRAIVGIHANLRNEGDHHAVIFRCIDENALGIITTTMPHHFSDETVVTFTHAPNVPAKSKKLQANGTFYYAKPCEPVVGRDNSCTFRLYTSEDRDPENVITFTKGELESGAFMVQERDEIKIMHGVMQLTHLTAGDGYKPLSEVDMLEYSMQLNKSSMEKILENGHSRLPVYCENKHNVRGFLLAKKMIVIGPDSGAKVSDVDVAPMVLVPPDIPMFDLLNKFQSERCHIALVTSHPNEVRRAWQTNAMIPPDVHMMGIITLEDIIEKLIQEDIFDEHDEHVDQTPGSSVVTPRLRVAPERSVSPERRPPSRAKSSVHLKPPSEGSKPRFTQSVSMTTPSSTSPVTLSIPKRAEGAGTLQEPLLSP